MRRAALTACALAALTACGKGATQDALADGAPVPALTLTPVTWTSAGAGVGAVHAVTELAEQVYVFGEGGAQVFAAGIPLSSDSSVTAWRGAATIPAADGTGWWAVGLDDKGALWRVRATGQLEAISARYGLDKQDVLDVADMGGGYTAFALGTALVVSDGATVTRYDAAARAVAGGAGLVAWADGDLVRRFDPKTGTLEGWRLPGVQAVAMSTAGRIAAATDRALYYESGTLNLNLVYVAAPGARMASVAAAGQRFWFTSAGRVGSLERNQVQRTGDAPIASEPAKLYGSPSGDLWAVASGTLRRFANAAAGDFTAWQTTVMPIFARVCSSCHLPTGTAGVDLASYDKWKRNRTAIYERVWEQKPSPMPPAGSGVTLSDAEREAIRAWATAP